MRGSAMLTWPQLTKRSWELLPNMNELAFKCWSNVGNTCIGLLRLLDAYGCRNVGLAFSCIRNIIPAVANGCHHWPNITPMLRAIWVISGLLFPISGVSSACSSTILTTRTTVMLLEGRLIIKASCSNSTVFYMLFVLLFVLLFILLFVCYSYVIGTKPQLLLIHYGQVTLDDPLNNPW